jgi:hypothetical protein
MPKAAIAETTPLASDGRGLDGFSVLEDHEKRDRAGQRKIDLFGLVPGFAQDGARTEFDDLPGLRQRIAIGAQQRRNQAVLSEGF